MSTSTALKIAAAQGSATEALSRAGGAFQVALFNNGSEVTGNGYIRQSVTGVGTGVDADGGNSALCPITETATFAASGGAIVFDQVKVFRSNGTTLEKALWIGGAIADGEEQEIAVRFVVPADYPKWQEYSVKADDSTDNLTSLQRYLTAIGVDGGIADLPAGRIKVSDTTEIPDQVVLAGSLTSGTTLVAPAGFTGRFLESVDYLDHLGDNDQWASEGYPCRLGVNDLCIDGILTDDLGGGFSVYENATFVATDARSATDLVAIATVASGVNVSNVHVYQWPGTAWLANRGTGTLTGVSQIQDWEAAEFHSLTANGVLAGLHIQSGADCNISDVTIANFRDFGMKLEGAAHNVYGSNHIYGGATSDVGDTQGVAYILAGTGHTVHGQLQCDAVRKGVYLSGNEHTINGPIILKYLIGVNTAGSFTAGVGVDFYGYSNHAAEIRSRNVRGGSTIVKVRPTATDTSIDKLRCDLSSGVGDSGSSVVALDVQADGFQLGSGKIIVAGSGGATMASFTAINFGTTSSYAPDGCTIVLDVYAAGSPSSLTGIKINAIGTGNDILLRYRGSSITPFSNPNGVSLTGNTIRSLNIDTGTLTTHT